MTREEQRLHLEKCMTECMAEPSDPHPQPWSWGIGYHDGWFFQFFDATGEKILGDGVRDPEDAARILKVINGLATALRAAHAIIPGGSHCDPQRVADDVREIAARAGVIIQD